MKKKNALNLLHNNRTATYDINIIVILYSSLANHRATLQKMVDMVDPYSHQSMNLFYSPVNIPGPGCSDSIFSTALAGCECTTTCTVQCSHLTQYGASYHTNKLIMMDTARPVIECNSDCACEPARCGNRVVQAGPSNYLRVVMVGTKGWGVLAGKDIDTGDYVCEYAGEVIGEEVARARLARQEEGEGNYILVLREFAGEKLVQKTIVDPTGD